MFYRKLGVYVCIEYGTMPFRLVYRTADISALSRNLDSVEIYIRCLVHKCEWRKSILYMYSQFVLLIQTILYFAHYSL